MRRHAHGALMLALMLTASTGAARARAERVALVIDPARSEVRFRAQATGHAFTGKTRRIEGKATLAPGGLFGVEGATAGVEAGSLETGNGIRDQKMRRLLETDRFPRIAFRATGFTPREKTVPGAFRGVLAGLLTIRGVTKPVALDVTGAWAGSALRASGSGRIRFTDFGMKPPRVIGLLRVKDDVRLEFDVATTPASPAPVAGR